MFDWNDLRYFIAVAQTGSTLAAGRALRVSQTTAARRIAALEAAVGLTLFERRQSGYTLTVAGEALRDQARAVETTAGVFADAAAAQAREIGGVVRLTTDQIYAVTVLVPMLRDLHETHPAIRVELDTTPEVRDLAAGAADIALRSSRSMTGTGVVGRRVGDDDWTAYCSRSYAAINGTPHSRRDLLGHTLIGGGGEGVWRYYSAWLRENGLESAIAIQYDSAVGLLAAVRSGMGIAVLPSFVVDQDPDLVRCLPPADSGKRGLWLLTHERQQHVPQVRAVLDFIGERLSRWARLPALTGPGPR